MSQLSPKELAELVAKALELVRPAYLSREQMASELGVTLPTLRKLEAEEGLPVHHLGGRIFRYTRAEVDAWVQTRNARDKGAA